MRPGLGHHFGGLQLALAGHERRHRGDERIAKRQCAEGASSRDVQYGSPCGPIPWHTCHNINGLSVNSTSWVMPGVAKRVIMAGTACTRLEGISRSGPASGDDDTDLVSLGRQAPHQRRSPVTAYVGSCLLLN